ncbi:hypothetical protein HY732_04170, partial [Candidatus Uhrbacteria bacterium]|nr:hypothetical protein [Candidatus Uhrbacteria bacterium]
MSQRISIHTINLSELIVHFGSRDEAILRAVAGRLQKEGGGPVLGNDTTDKPEGVQEYTFDFFVAAREIIRGTVHPGNSLPEESQAMVNAVFTL